jgi:hypothetical protein
MSPDFSPSPNSRHGALPGSDKLTPGATGRGGGRAAGAARDNPLLCDLDHRPGGGSETKKSALKQEDASMSGFVIHPDLLWLAVAFVTVMAGMLAAAPE